MFYEPSIAREFVSLHDFRLAHRNTSYGELATEDERNAAGLYTLTDEQPEHNPATHVLQPGCIEARGAAWVRVWQAQPLPVEDVRANLQRAVTDMRWQRETGGITLPGGITVGTAIDDQNRITSVIANAQAAGVESVDFKSASGWLTLTVAEVQAIAAAIAVHVQACFSAERAHHEAIAAASAVELQVYDIEAGWPAGA
ncbi:DUF4376 domain-containing protein [Acidovorax sp. SDU_ACID1]|uniref:DUF4376 domain-containing protein n=1 Tax=Acidovorax sp. SDU_ACID1 TaxID=3136632 RepID=UPI003873C80F